MGTFASRRNRLVVLVVLTVITGATMWLLLPLSPAADRLGNWSPSTQNRCATIGGVPAWYLSRRATVEEGGRKALALAGELSADNPAASAVNPGVAESGLRTDGALALAAVRGCDQSARDRLVIAVTACLLAIAAAAGILWALGGEHRRSPQDGPTTEPTT